MADRTGNDRRAVKSKPAVANDTTTSQQTTSNGSSPYLPMFEGFRAELDEHHDRRERVIKASRDITAASKKVIFSLQRVRSVGNPVPEHIAKTHQSHHDITRTQFTSVAPELQGINAFRYARNISGGCQEYMEAVSFEHYLVTGKLLSYEQAARDLRELDAHSGPGVHLSMEDYLLGIYDMTGELMRFAITTMATRGHLLEIDHTSPENSGQAHGHSIRRSILTDMRDLRTALDNLDVRGGPFARDVEKKAEVMRQSVEKVEKAIYGIVVRGAERPSGWMPDLSDSRAVEAEA